MGLGFFFKHLTGIRQTPLLRFSLVLISENKGPASRRSSMPWSSLTGEKIIALQSTLPLQQLIDKHLVKAGVLYQPTLVLNWLNSQIAMTEVGEGVAIVPSFTLPECQRRGLAFSRLTNPVVHLDLCQIRQAGKRLPPIAQEFTAFLQSYIAGWAGRSGILKDAR